MAYRSVYLISAFLLGLISFSIAQDLPNRDLEKAIQNPIANLGIITLPE